MSSLCGVFGIPTQFGEREGSGEITFSRGSIKGTRIYQLPWGEYPGFIQYLLGQQVATPTGGITLSYPEVFSTQFPFLYCLEVEVKGEQQQGLGGDGKITYRTAIVTGTYKPLDDGESIHLSGQMITIPRFRYAWIGQNAQELQFIMAMIYLIYRAR